MSIEEQIRRELDRLPSTSARIQQLKATICCPFHDDSSPSASINLDPSLVHKGRKVAVGRLYCFACRKSWPWNQVAEKLGLQQFAYGNGSGSEPGAEPTAIKRVLRQKLVDSSVSEADLLKNLHIGLASPLPDTFKWRGFGAKFLRALDIKQGLCSDSGERCIVAPVYSVEHEIIGGFKGWFEKRDGFPSYLNAPGDWVRDEALWPIHLHTGKVLWLVEGQRDAMRLVYIGLPAAAILGANNFSETKLQLIQSLGVERLILMMDGDKAGVRASNMIKRMCKEMTDLDVKVCKLAQDAKKLGLEKVDPNDLPIDNVRYYYRKYGLGCRIKRPWADHC